MSSRLRKLARAYDRGAYVQALRMERARNTADDLIWSGLRPVLEARHAARARRLALAMLATTAALYALAMLAPRGCL